MRLTLRHWSLSRRRLLSLCGFAVMQWSSFAIGQEPSSERAADVADEISPQTSFYEAALNTEAEFLPASMSLSQPQPAQLPPLEVMPTPLAMTRAGVTLFDSRKLSDDVMREQRKRRAARTSSSIILGLEGQARSSTDAGSMIGKSASSVGLGVQRRSPIVNDARIHSTRVGSQNSKGSYWFPARIDLDTHLNKIDSCIIDDVILVQGPYSALYGPGFHFYDIETLTSPRYESFETHGSSSLDYRTNGEQWYARQTGLLGDENWGVRAGYGHRTGSDYESGNGTEIPSSYKSRDIDLAAGFDWGADDRFEFHYMRLDQTDVEFPGQAFDMNFLVTDAFEVTWQHRDWAIFDEVELEVWHNQTRFSGDTLRSGKQRQFPVFALAGFSARTDVASSSSGYRWLLESETDDIGTWTVGTDLRHLRQELNEYSTVGPQGPLQFVDRNSPIPKSHSTNPGLLAEHELQFDELTLRSGVRLDAVSTELDVTRASVNGIGTDVVPVALSDVLGTTEFDQDFFLASVFLTSSYQWDEHLTLTSGAGRAERAPNLTELYAAELFMFLQQNGLNSVTGNPLLAKEQLWQVDVGLVWEWDAFRIRGNAFHGWIENYITFENMGMSPAFTAGADIPTRLKYVNSELATLAGFNVSADADITDMLNGFATLSYLVGQDRTRNGDSATIPFDGSFIPLPSIQDPTNHRGFYAGQPRSKSEPLPGIVPLESRIGVRLHAPTPKPEWAIELAARIVDDQQRVATSLRERPTPGFTTWDLRGYWRPRANWLLTAGAENFTDKQYLEHLDYRSSTGIAVFQPGVNLYFGSEWSF